MKGILSPAIIILSLFSALYAQNSTGKIFSKEWAYPEIQESPAKKNLINVKAPTCQIPPEGTREFGSIDGLGLDKNDNLYVWDNGYNALFKFSPDGKKLWRKKYEKDGKAEGTFGNVGLAFTVSESGQIALGDKSGRTISLLDSSGKFIRRFKVDMLPGAITFGKDGDIYVTGFGFSYKGDLVQHYSSAGHFINAFCKRENDSKAIDWSGNSGRLSTDKDGNIYFSHFYPYRIEKFSKDGILLKKIEQNRENFIAPIIVNNSGAKMVECPSGLRSISFIPQGYLSVAVFYNQREGKWNMDLFDLDGNLKAAISQSSYPVPFYCRCSASDSKGNLYYDVDAGIEPAIIKYSVNYNELVK